MRPLGDNEGKVLEHALYFVVNIAGSLESARQTIIERRARAWEGADATPTAGILVYTSCYRFVPQHCPGADQGPAAGGSRPAADPGGRTVDPPQPRVLEGQPRRRLGVTQVRKSEVLGPCCYPCRSSPDHAPCFRTLQDQVAPPYGHGGRGPGSGQAWRSGRAGPGGAGPGGDAGATPGDPGRPGADLGLGRRDDGARPHIARVCVVRSIALLGCTIPDPRPCQFLPERGGWNSSLGPARSPA